MVTAITYLLAGVAKIAGPLGWSWAMGHGLRSQLMVDAIRKELLGDGSASLAIWLYENALLFTVLGCLTLCIELVAPLATLGRRPARIWAASALLFHWGVFLTMGIRFRYQLSGIAFAAFFTPSGRPSGKALSAPSNPDKSPPSRF